MKPAISPKQGPGPWFFLPQGVLWHAAARSVVIADLHLGYEHMRARGGDCLPRYSVDDVKSRLAPIIDFTACDRLIVAGDVVESKDALSRASNALGEFVDWLRARSVQPVFVRGNHDAGSLGGCPEAVEVDGWTIRHGHDGPSDSVAAEINGHLHPALRWSGHTFRVFLSSPRQILLPAFSSDASGVDLADPFRFPESSWGGHLCWVCRDNDVLPFGTLESLRSRLVSLHPSGERMQNPRKRFRRARP